MYSSDTAIAIEIMINHSVDSIRVQGIGKSTGIAIKQRSMQSVRQSKGNCVNTPFRGKFKLSILDWRAQSMRASFLG